MNMVTINIKGKHYPCYQTAGAMLRYRRLKGKEAQDIDITDLDNVAVYLWCCCKSACEREEVDFPYPDDQSMMDCLLMEDIDAWGREMAVANAKTETPEDDDEKKSPSR